MADQFQMPEGVTLSGPTQPLQKKFQMPAGVTLRGATKPLSSPGIPEPVISPATDQRGMAGGVPATLHGVTQAQVDAATIPSKRELLRPEKLLDPSTYVDAVSQIQDAWARTGQLAGLGQRVRKDIGANVQGMVGSLPTWTPPWRSDTSGKPQQPGLMDFLRAARSAGQGAYQLATHPTQQQLAETLARLTGYSVDEIKRREQSGDQLGVLSQMIADAPFQIGGELAGEVGHAGYKKFAGRPQPPPTIPLEAMTGSRTMPGMHTPETIWQRPTPAQPLPRQRGLMLPPAPAGAELGGIRTVPRVLGEELGQPPRKVTPTHPPTIERPRRLVLTPEEEQVSRARQAQLKRQASEAGTQAAAYGKAGAKLNYQQRQVLAQRGYTAQQMNRLSAKQIQQIFGGSQ